MLQSVLIVAFFLFIAVLMFTRKIQTILALPILAIGIALIAGVPMVGKVNGVDMGLFNYVIESGLVGQASPIASVILAAWLGQAMSHSGVTRRMVNTAAEYGGDRPFLVTILLVVATAVLSTVLSGLGSTIMVGSIVLPIMMSLGVPGLTAGCAFLASRGIGLMLNMANWRFFATTTGVKQAEVQTFAFILCGLTAIAVLVFIIVEFRLQGVKFSCAEKNLNFSNATDNLKTPALSLLTPIVPIVLVMLFGVPINVAFIAGLLFLFMVTALANLSDFRKIVSIVNKSGIEGVANSASAILLLMGIGMILKSLTHPLVKECLNPMLSAIIPTTATGYIIFFILVAPLSLYRGPMNLWGLGSGFAAVIIGLGTLPANAVFAAFLSSERIQGISDPTNTHSVWVANYVGADVNQIMLKLLPYLWSISACGVVIASMMYL